MVSTSTGCTQWLSLTKSTLKVALVGWNRSLVARNRNFGWARVKSHQCPESFWTYRIDEDASDTKSNRLHDDNTSTGFDACIHLRYILQIILKWSVNFPKSWTSIGSSANTLTAGSFPTSNPTTEVKLRPSSSSSSTGVRTWPKLLHGPTNQDGCCLHLCPLSLSLPSFLAWHSISYVTLLGSRSLWHLTSRVPYWD